MVELRWTVPEGTTTEAPRLQWRTRAADPGGGLTIWGPWQDVPIVVRPRVSGSVTAGLSWSGFNVHGDPASIEEVKRMQHAAGQVPELQAYIRDLERNTQQKRSA